MGELDSCLKKLSDIVHSAGYMTESEFFSSKRNRRTLYSKCSESFLSIKGGIPTFPIRDQFGNISFSVLKRSMLAASKLEEGSYKSEIVKKLNEQFSELLKSKGNKKEDRLITRQIRDLGSLGAF